MRYLSLLLLLVSSSSFAASVWKVSNGDSHLFIGGTMHLLSRGDYPLPEEYEKAYQQAQQLVFETDIGAINSPDFAAKIVAQMSYPAGTDVSSVLSAKTMSKLEKYLNSRGMPQHIVQHFKQFKPSLLSLTLSNIELQAIGLTQAGVDQFYFDKANKHSKRISWLESVDTQMAFIADMGKGDENALIDYTLDEINKIKPMLEKLKTQWRAGDMPGMNTTSVLPLQRDYPQIYEDLLLTRNNNWMPVILPMLETDTVEFILVGALHLAGKDSVLSQLRQQGYNVEMLK